MSRRSRTEQLAAFRHHCLDFADIERCDARIGSKCRILRGRAKVKGTVIDDNVAVVNVGVDKGIRGRSLSGKDVGH
ncbi:MAG: hypothetical protein IT352_04060 [Gemmatimonadales bacterium]|nr:hypothetical protein [Gemmatimonadales bacterium]